MAERIIQLRRSDLGRVIVAQQTTEAAIDSLFEPVLVTDSQGRITRLNRAAELLFGARAEAIGKPIAEVAHDQRITIAVLEALRAERSVAAQSVARPSLSRLAVWDRFSPANHAYARRGGASAGRRRVVGGHHALARDRPAQIRIRLDPAHYLQAPLLNLQMGLHCS